MATQAYTAVIDHSTDAGFRAWATGLHNAFVAAGLVVTADTGQADFTTAVRPAVNTTTYYKIYRMNDTQQSAAPVFIRVEYGTGATATAPRINVNVGTSSSGAGVIGGFVSLAATRVTADAAATSASTLYQTRVCVADGVFWFAWGLGSVAAPGTMGFFAIGRTVDLATGVSTAYGASMMYMQASILLRRVRFSNTADAVTPVVGSSCLVVGGVTATLVSGANPQVFRHYFSYPETIVWPWGLTCIRTEIGANTQFSVAVVGSTARNYVSFGVECSAGNIALPANAVNTLAMLWE